MSQPFRFVHASDFHLERPLAGLTEIPAHLTDLLIDAPYAAAERVFELAQSERADFLVLAGDIVHVDRAGPRAVAFLDEQFERLAAREIAVYWLAGPAERRSPWPSEIKLPGNVHLFTRGTTQAMVHHADGDDLAVIVGYGGAKGEGRPEPATKNKAGRYTIGVRHGALDSRNLGKLGVDYWACGGSHRRRTAGRDRHTISCSGSPQGRSPQRGAHGAVIVDVDEHNAARPRFVPTDLVRYRRLRVELDLAASRAEQQRVLSDRVQAAFEHAPGLDLLLRWRLVPVGAAPASDESASTSREALATAWLRWLRQEFGTDSPAAWSLSVDVVPRGAVTAADMAQDGSLLADFLAAIDEAEEAHEELPLAGLVPEGVRHTAAADILHVADRKQRRRLLRQARALGFDLLNAEEPSA